MSLDIWFCHLVACGQPLRTCRAGVDPRGLARLEIVLTPDGAEPLLQPSGSTQQ